jgi:hypothetical protein
MYTKLELQKDEFHKLWINESTGVILLVLQEAKVADFGVGKMYSAVVLSPGTTNHEPFAFNSSDRWILDDFVPFQHIIKLSNYKIE